MDIPTYQSPKMLTLKCLTLHFVDIMESLQVNNTPSSAVRMKLINSCVSLGHMQIGLSPHQPMTFRYMEAKVNIMMMTMMMMIKENR